MSLHVTPYIHHAEDAQRAINDLELVDKRLVVRRWRPSPILATTAAGFASKLAVRGEGPCAAPSYAMRLGCTCAAFVELSIVCTAHVGSASLGTV